ncbi:MAG: hypothetical protein IJC30_02515 [Alphaproteobacteria bacterium]|nr:hypothetical protein [Alphaproteobacteria bacterium]
MLVLFSGISNETRRYKGIQMPKEEPMLELNKKTTKLSHPFTNWREPVG